MRRSIEELAPNDAWSYPHEYDVSYHGRTLRDDVAIAMMPILAQQDLGFTPETITRWALKYADAYLIARKEDL